MEEVKLQMDNYIKKLLNAYDKANSISKKKRIAFDLVSFSIFYDMIFPGVEMPWDNDMLIQAEYDNYCCDVLDKFIEHTEDNHKLYYDLSETVINSFKSVKYPYYKNNYKAVDLPRLTSDESTEIILSFLKDFGNEYYETMLEMSKNNDLLGVNMAAGDLSGMTFPINAIKKNFIVLSDSYENNVYSTTTSIHEFGHAYEFILDNNSDSVSQSLTGPFYEVSSCFFEYAFLNYLKENRIYTKSADICLDFNYKTTLAWFAEMNIITRMKDITLDEYQQVHFENKEEIERIRERLNYYNLPLYTEGTLFVNPFIYGMGHLLAIHLYDNYKQDKEKFKQNFKNMLTSYPLINNLDVFKEFNITEETLKEGKILRKTLNNFKDDFLIK